MSNDGFSKLRKRMKAIPADVRKAVRPALETSANEMAGTMKVLAESSRDSGALIDSIEVTTGGKSTPAYSQPGGSTIVDEDQAVVTAGNRDVRYAHLVEYGTLKAPAQPFFWPSVRLNQKRATNRIKRAMAKGIREHWGKP